MGPRNKTGGLWDIVLPLPIASAGRGDSGRSASQPTDQCYHLQGYFKNATHYIDFQLTDVRRAGDPALQSWKEMHPFYFADGTTVAPAKLRDDGEQNYLSPEVRAFGLSILGLDWSLCLGNCPWVYCFRKHRVLAVSQPVFLYQLSLGVATFVAPIFTLSWDESFGWSEQQLSAGCTSSPWLIALGHTTVYMALFTKLWRINKVLQV